MKRKVAAHALKFGMYVEELDRPWLGTPFLFQGFPITTQEELTQLQDLCDYVYVHETEPGYHKPGRLSAPRFPTARININKPDVVPHHRHDHDELLNELQHVKQTYDSSHRYIKDTLSDVRLGRGVNIRQAKHLVAGMTESIIQNDNALILLSQLKKYDDYTVHHSLNVCILSLLLGKHLGLKENDLRTLGLGALLHDIGKMRVPIEILNKPGRLTPEEFELISHHPEFGIQILKQNDTIPYPALEMVYAHHERVDGSGYPRKLTAERIGLFPRIAAVVDVYDAITTTRVYHQSLSPHEALRVMYERDAGAFPPKLLDKFIQCLSIFPIGSIVELDNGDIAIVMSVNRRKHLLPIVLLVLDNNRQPYQPRRVCNLELMSVKGKPLKIKKILESNAHGVSTAQILFEEGNFKALQLER